MKKLIVFQSVFIFSMLLSAQDKVNNCSKWYLKPAIGINLPVNGLLSGDITDNLLEYDDNSYYWQVFSASYFFSEKWGVDFSFQAGHSRSLSGRDDRFRQMLEKKYGDRYFVSSSSGAEYSNFSLIEGGINRGYLGVVYRYEKPNYIIMPKLSIGVTSFYTDWGGASLKEKGSNNVYKLTYSPIESPNDYFTLAPSVSFGYRLSKRIVANIDILYSYYRTNIKYVEQLRNTFSDEVSAGTIDYKKNIQTVTIGVGLMIELKPVRR